MKEQEKKNFWVVIPTLLFEDNSLSINAKRVYGLISSLARKNGFCWASNRFISKTLEIPLSTVRFSLKKLQESGWIKTELNKDRNKRKIFLNFPDFQRGDANGLAGGDAKTPDQRWQGDANAPDQKIPNNNIYINNKEKEKEINKEKEKEKPLSYKQLEKRSSNLFDSFDLQVIKIFYELGYSIRPRELKRLSDWLDDIFNEFKDRNIIQEAKKFRDYWEAQRRKVKSHKLAFRNWLLNSRKYGKD